MRLKKEFIPILAETIWHDITIDARVKDDSLSRFIQIKGILNKLKFIPKKILEIGANDRFTIHYLSEYFNIESFSFDISEQSLNRSEYFAEKENIKSNTTYTVGDFHDLPYESNSFDFVYVHESIHHSLTPEKVLLEMERVTKKNGYICILKEPAKRKACLHTFLSNRIESFTSFENYLKDKDIFYFLSTPVGNARSESLFYMIENTDISLNNYINAFKKSTLVNLSLANNTELYETKKDKEYFDLIKKGFSEDEFSKTVSEDLISIIEKSKIYLDEKTLAAGFNLPQENEILSFSRKLYSYYLLLNKDDSFYNKIDIYGAHISFIMKKTINSIEKEISTKPYKFSPQRDFALQKINKLPISFDENEWSFLKSPGDINVITPKINGAKIKVEIKKGQLFIRLWCQEESELFSLNIIDSTNNEILEKINIVASESRLITCELNNVKEIMIKTSNELIPNLFLSHIIIV